MTKTETLVLLPGLMCDVDVWSPLYPHLPFGLATLVIDYGAASRITAMAQQVLERAPARFALAGHSMGGRVAMEVVRMAPERVLRVALLDTGHLARPAGTAGNQEAAKRYALLQVAQTQGVAAMAHAWVQGMVHPDRLHDAALIDAIVTMFARKSADAFAAQIEALLHRPDASEVLRKIAVPTLFLCGAQDVWSSPEQHQQMCNLVPGAVLDVVDNAGHMAPMERPEAVAQCFTRWLRRC
ncbi:MAG: alpha/beta fold hydrolase [Burkholderiales bacterium]|nr:alpha/beta fold hydrolase [Burkholderiales bacterium]